MLAKWNLYLVKAGVIRAAGWLHLVVGLGFNFQESFNSIPDFSMLLCDVCLPQCISSSLLPMQPEFPLSMTTGYPEQRQKQPILFRKRRKYAFPRTSGLSTTFYQPRQVMRLVWSKRMENRLHLLMEEQPACAGRRGTIWGPSLATSCILCVLK